MSESVCVSVFLIVMVYIGCGTCQRDYCRSRCTERRSCSGGNDGWWKLKGQQS